MNEYIVKQQLMICGSSEAQNRKYHMIVQGNETWLYADQPNAADNVYYHNKISKNKDGFAGRTLSFTLVDGTIIKLLSPWHTNAEALYNKTGKDIRNTLLQKVVVANSLEYREFKSKYGLVKLPVLKGIFHIDEKPVLGNFNRGHNIAKGIANSIGKTVRLYIQTTTGSILGFEKPDKEPLS
jgi:hypothetical protein